MSLQPCLPRSHSTHDPSNPQISTCGERAIPCSRRSSAARVGGRAGCQGGVYFFIRDMVEALELRVPLIPTKANPADFLTKPLDKALFFAHRDSFMNVRGAGDNTTA